MNVLQFASEPFIAMHTSLLVYKIKYVTVFFIKKYIINTSFIFVNYRSESMRC